MSSFLPPSVVSPPLTYFPLLEFYLFVYLKKLFKYMLYPAWGSDSQHQDQESRALPTEPVRCRNFKIHYVCKCLQHVLVLFFHFHETIFGFQLLILSANLQYGCQWSSFPKSCLSKVSFNFQVEILRNFQSYSVYL